MRDGKYNKKININNHLSTMISPCFDPYLKWEDQFNFSCGTTAISTLTGISPTKIQKLIPKNIKYWTDKAMIKYLKSKGYNIFEITKSNITQDKFFRSYSIGPHHVLLVGQFIMRDEGTWSIVYNGQYIHNFDSCPLKLYEFFNNPTDTVYVISHKKWK